MFVQILVCNFLVLIYSKIYLWKIHCQSEWYTIYYTVEISRSQPQGVGYKQPEQNFWRMYAFLVIIFCLHNYYPIFSLLCNEQPWNYYLLEAGAQKYKLEYTVNTHVDGWRPVSWHILYGYGHNRVTKTFSGEYGAFLSWTGHSGLLTWSI